MATNIANPEEAIEVPARVDSPLPATRNRPPLEEGVAERFAESDSGIDLTTLPIIGRILKLGLKKR